MKRLAAQYRNSSEPAYLVLLVLSLSCYLLYQVYWTEPAMLFLAGVLPAANTALLWFAMVLAALPLILWKRKVWIAVPAALLFCGAYYLAQDMAFKRYYLMLGVFLALLACGKSYRKILNCFLFCHAGVLLLGALGLAFGFALDRVKEETYGTGHSFGIIHPNNFAHIVFLVLVLCWYLYFRRRKWLSFPLFWLAAIPIFTLCKCRTVTFFLLLFPPISLLSGIQGRKRERTGALPGGLFWWERLLALAPFLFLALTLFLSSQLELLQKTKDSPLYNMLGRFVQSGVALHYYGFPLKGRIIDTSGALTLVIGGHTQKLHVMDNAYVTYLIEEGVIWLLCVLGWYSAGMRRMLVKRDYGLLLIAVFMLLLSLMERVGLMAVYNFTALYPLAAIQKKEAPAIGDLSENGKTAQEEDGAK